ncbi:unnamed protein product [Tenebrio molitor]|nr:unnamed protein product [Tenebrio molitor]
MNEKILALSFLKTSGKAYRFLSKIFCLPSIRTLTNLLNEIPYGAGINRQVFNSLKVAVQQLKNRNDRLCSVIFDEMAIKPSLSYNKKQDIIDGLEDFGNGDRSSHIADHANVFMVKGIHRQWKQAVSFNFSSGPIKSQKLKPLLLEIIKECKQIGLEVVATVCDQGSANQAVINSLLKDTHNKCILKMGYRIHFVVSQRMELMMLYPCMMFLIYLRGFGIIYLQKTSILRKMV